MKRPQAEGCARTGRRQGIALLGKQDGFFGNPDVHIPLPGVLQKGRKTLDRLGLKKQTAALDLAINRAAEAAVPQAQQLFANAIGSMSLADALSILKGPDDAATQYFRATMTAPLTEAFMPIVGKSTAQLDLAKKYNVVATRGCCHRPRRTAGRLARRLRDAQGARRVVPGDGARRSRDPQGSARPGECAAEEGIRQLTRRCRGCHCLHDLRPPSAGAE